MANKLTREEAIEIYESEEWKGWSDERLVGFQLFEDRLCVPWGVFHAAIERVFNRPVYTHEFGLNREGLQREFLHEIDPPTLEEIIDLIPEEKLIILDLTKDEEPSDIGEINWKVDDSAD